MVMVTMTPTENLLLELFVTCNNGREIYEPCAGLVHKNTQMDSLHGYTIFRICHFSLQYICAHMHVLQIVLYRYIQKAYTWNSLMS